MPRGLKQTSSPIQISAAVTQTASNVNIEERLELSLNPLDQEVFVVTQVNLDIDAPDLSEGNPTRVSASLSTTSRTGPGSIADPNVIASAERIILNSGEAQLAWFDREDPTFTAINEDYIGIIATSDAFLQLGSLNSGGLKQARVRVYGYRAKAEAATYAALVQSQTLSS